MTKYYNLAERIAALTASLKNNGLDTQDGLAAADQRADRRLDSIVLTKELDENGKHLTSKSAARYVQVSAGPFVTPRGNVPLYLSLEWLAAQGFDAKHLPERLVVDLRVETQAPQIKRRAAKCAGPKPAPIVTSLPTPEHDAIEESCAAMGIETTQAQAKTDMAAAGSKARETPGLEQNVTTKPAKPKEPKATGTGEPTKPVPMPAWEQRAWAVVGSKPKPKQPLTGKKAGALITSEASALAAEVKLPADDPALRRVVVEILQVKQHIG